jgi:hypothetical protein
MLYTLLQFENLGLIVYAAFFFIEYLARKKNLLFDATYTIYPRFLICMQCVQHAGFTDTTSMFNAQFLSRQDYSYGGVIRTLPPEFVGDSRRGHCV